MSIHLSKIHMKNNDWKERLNVVYSGQRIFRVGKLSFKRIA